MIVSKRIYEAPGPGDGYRVLVDRLWPRGITREKAAIDEWAKEIAPSEELRRAFAGNSANWDEFERRYRAELAAPGSQPMLVRLRSIARKGRHTLLFAKRDETRNNAIVLRAVLDERH